MQKKNKQVTLMRQLYFGNISEFLPPGMEFVILTFILNIRLTVELVPYEKHCGPITQLVMLI